MASPRRPWRCRDSQSAAWRHSLSGQGRVSSAKARMSEPEAESARHELQAVLELQGLPAPWELRTTRGWRVEASGWSGLAGPLHPADPGVFPGTKGPTESC